MEFVFDGDCDSDNDSDDEFTNKQMVELKLFKRS